MLARWELLASDLERASAAAARLPPPLTVSAWLASTRAGGPGEAPASAAADVREALEAAAQRLRAVRSVPDGDVVAVDWNRYREVLVISRKV